MQKWEDIIKEKMEEIEGSLPDSVFTEFHARLEGTTQRRVPLIWVIAPAVAAGLAAVLMLHEPSVPENAVQIIRKPDVPVAVITDSILTDITEEPLIERHGYREQEPADSPRVSEPIEIIEQEETADKVQTDDKVLSEPVSPETVEAVTSPFIPENVREKPLKILIVPATSVIAGGGLLAAVATSVKESGDVNKTNNIHEQPDLPNLVGPSPGPPKDSTAITKDVLTGPKNHHSPIKTGLSLKIPVSERLGITTGLEYSLYCSSFSYSLSGEKTQYAHYLGVPVRLDWSFASNRWFDVFVGGGIVGDYCIRASLAGEKIKGDGFGLSFIGALGTQINITKRIGFYLEPELSWTVPSDNHVLETYRSENPFMFSIATGLRINLGKRNIK